MAASRENVWLQAALIVFVLISVVLAATTWVYYTGARRQAELATTAANRATAEGKRADASSSAFNILAHMAGNAKKTEGELQSYESMVATSGTPELKTQLEAIQAAFKADMQNFASDFPAENRDYHTLPEHLMGVIRDRNQQVADAISQVKSKDAELQSVKTTEQNKTREAEKGRDEAIADRDTIKEQYAQERTRINAEKETLSTTVNQKNAAIAAAAKAAQDEKNALLTKIADTTKALATVQEELAMIKRTSFESSDGRIAFINQRDQTGFVNLGSADGLRPATTFSVYDQSETQFGSVEPKGKIEITRVTGAHQAEFRVVEAEPINPVLTNDVIQSPVWNAGDKIRFALVGILDIDGDGKSDREQIKNVIRTNNGTVDAEMLENGDIVGTMSVKTRYLVEGDRPNEASDKAVIEAYTRMMGQADEYSIQRIDLQKLLDYMGYRSQATVTPLGEGADSNAPAPSGNSAFRERRAPGNEE